MIQELYQAPCNIAWFQKELDKLCVPYGNRVKLRVAWCPQLVELLAVNANGDKLEYKKYPVLDGYFEEWVEGYTYLRRIGSGWVGVGYQKNGEKLVPAGVLPTDIAVADLRRVNPSIHIFVIERLVPIEEAVRDDKEKRRLSLANLGFDVFEPMTDGVWEWRADISEHRDGCCDMAREREVYCHGLYREPDRRDLDRVRDALQRMEATRVLDYDDKSSLIEQRAKNTVEAIDRYRHVGLTEVLQEVREESALDRIAQTRSRVVGGINPPRHRTVY